MAGCDAAPNDPYAAAQAAVADGKPRSALDLVATAIDQDPGNASYRLLAGDIAMSLGLPDRAITEFEAVSADAPEASLAKAKLAEAQVAGNYMQAAGETVASLTMDNPFAYVAAIAFNLAQGDAAKAFTLLDAGLAKYPDNHRLITVDAERLWSQAKRDEALARLEPVLSARPVVAQAHLFAGQLHLGERSPQKATEAFEHVLSAMPNNQTAMLALAAIARDKGDEKAAVNWINKANDAGSPHPVGLLFAAQMAYDAGEIDRAFELVERAPPAFAEQPEFARLRGLVDAARNQHAMAALALQEYVKDTGGDPLTRRVLANSLAETGEFEAAWSAIKPTVNHPQTDGATLVLALQLAQKTGNNDSEIRKAIARKQAAPSLAKPMREAGKAIRAGDWAKADGIYAPLLSGAGKDDPMLLNNAAAVKTRLGKHKAAVRLARRALDEAPDSPEIMDTLGWALWKEGVSVDEARTMLTRAREGAPSNRTINEHWAIAHAK
ncbi:MAG: tetratricopeptide repeat protein [Pseudomonadota bacterium]